MHADLRSHCAIDDQWSVIDNYGRSQATFLCSLLAFSDFLSETFDFLDYWMFDPWSILIQLNTLYTAIITIHLTTSSKKKIYAHICHDQFILNPHSALLINSR